jgi:hypothetical protein
LIKVYKNEGAALGAREGAIAFYTKKGVPVKLDPTQKSFTTFNKEGYAITKEFYAPDYSVASITTSNVTDKRYTLFWNPKLKPAKDGKYYVRFYNNEITNKFKIVLQGIDKEGNVIHVEKIIQ